MEKEYYYLLYDKSSKLKYYYGILEECELNNQVTSLEYNNALYQIEKLKKEEDEICNNISNEFNDLDKLCELCSQITGQAVVETENIELYDKRSITEPINLIFGSTIPDEVLIALRISNRMMDILKTKTINIELSKMDEDEKKEYISTFETYIYTEPKVDKQFLDIVDDHIKEAQNFEDIRKMYINAKYSFAFVKFKECKISDEYDLDEIKEICSYAVVSKVTEYISRIIKLNKETLTYKANQRRIMLEADYLRSLILQLSDIEYEAIIKAVEEALKENIITTTYGYTVIKNIFSFREEDLEKYNDNELELKRRF